MARPWLDVSDALLEPNFTDNNITVHRRTQIVNNYGETGSSTQIFKKVLAVVTTPGPNSLVRETDQENAGKIVTIISKFRFQTAATGRLPDIVLWHGNSYLVDKCDDYSSYGPGFVQTQATMTDYVPAPLT